MKILISTLLLLSLSGFSQTRGPDTQGVNEKNKKEITLIYKNISKEINSYLKKPHKKKLIKIYKTYLSANRFDKSYYSYEMLLPIYEKDKKILLSIAKADSFSKSEQDTLLNNIELMLREYNQGNDL